MWAGVIMVAALVQAGTPDAPQPEEGDVAIPVEDRIEDRDAPDASNQAEVQDREPARDPGGAGGPRALRARGVPAAPLAPAPQGPPLADSDPVVLARHAAPDGGATERVLEPSGGIFLHSLTRAGTVQVCTRVGSLFTLPLVRQEEAAGGEFVHVARDDSGALLRYVVQADGEPRAVVLLQPAPEALTSR